MFDWETEEEKLVRRMKIPANKKLEALHAMHQFVLKTMTKKRRNIF